METAVEIEDRACAVAVERDATVVLTPVRDTVWVDSEVLRAGTVVCSSRLVRLAVWFTESCVRLASEMIVAACCVSVCVLKLGVNICILDEACV